MTDRPILFSAPMVRALLDGRKMQTRRTIKDAPTAPGWILYSAEGKQTWLGPNGYPSMPCTVRFAKGDRLWVRETWRDEHPIAIQEGRYSQEGRAGIPGPPGVSYRTIYRADGEPLQAWRRADGEHPYFTLAGPADDIAARHPAVCSTFNRTDGRGAAWSPPIHMPRWASRITLTVTDVRVQRLYEISHTDAMAEGLEWVAPTWGISGISDSWQDDPRMAYRALWNAINGKGAADANPWIVALTFTVERRNIDA